MNILELEPFSLLLHFKKNPMCDEILNFPELSQLDLLNSNQKAMIHNLYIEKCLKENIKINPDLFTEVDIINIIKNVNMRNIFSNKKSIYKYSAIIYSKNKSKKILSFFYSKLKIMDAGFPIEDDIDMFQEVFVKSEFSRVPFYFFLGKKDCDITELKRFLKNTEPDTIKCRADEFIEFCLSELNFKAVSIVCNYLDYYDVFQKISKKYQVLFYFSRKENKVNTSFYNLIKMIMSKTEIDKLEKFKFLSKVFLLNQFQNEFFIEQATELEKTSEYRFCNSIRFDENILNFLIDNNFKLEFERSIIASSSIKTELLNRILEVAPFNYKKVGYNYLVKQFQKEELLKLQQNILKPINKDYSNIKKLSKSYSSINEDSLKYFNVGSMIESLQDKLLLCSTDLDFSNLIFNKKSKKARASLKLLYINNSLMSDKVSWAHHLSENGVNYDLILSFLEKTQTCHLHTMHTEDVNLFINSMRNVFSDKKFLSLLSTAKTSGEPIDAIDNRGFLDIVQQFKKIESMDQLSFAKKEIKHNKKSIKNLSQFHDFVSEKIIRLIEQEDYKLGQDDFFFIEDLKFKDYKFSIPRKNHDLIKMGDTLNICIGDGYYADQIVIDDIRIIFATNSSGKIFCIEYNLIYKSITQVKTNNNESLDKKSEEELNIFMTNTLKESKKELNE
jgi:hypothetical protein